MKAFFNRIFDFFNTIESKIAFYPTLLATVGLLFALFMGYLENQGISRKILALTPQLMVEDGDTALAVLSACLGGLISLMVFSFSMVMLLLSQASNNYSPRLLPGLISDRRHQFILGIFLASILYIIFILFSIHSSEEKYTLPGLSVLLGIIATIVCLVAFIYFIHNISQSIQINNILDNIFVQAKIRIKELVEAEKESSPYFPESHNWHEYSIGKGHYFQNISIDNVLDICEKHDTKIHILVPKGLFILSNAVFLKSEKKLNQETLDSIFANISFARGELIEDNYVLAFKQITEIAVKAMSPGINDPGTALNAIDYLTELFELRMQKSDSSTYSRERMTRVKIATVSFDQLLYNILASLRTYCKHDPIIAQKLLWMLGYLEKQVLVDKKYLEAVKKEKKQLLKQVQNALDSEYDFDQIAKLDFQ